jgi:hypothetical protein
MRKLKLLSPWSVSVQIGDEELKFYSARQSVLSSFAELTKDLLAAVSWYLKDPSTYAGYETKTDKVTNSTVHMGMPSSIQTIDHIEVKKNEYAGRLTDMLLNDKGRKALAALIISSLRDEYPETSNNRGYPKESDIQELVDGSDMTTFTALAAAAIKANWKALAEGFPKTMLAGMTKKVEKTLDMVIEKMGVENQEKDLQQ